MWLSGCPRHLLGPSHPFLTGRSSKKTVRTFKEQPPPAPRGQAAGAFRDAVGKITIPHPPRQPPEEILFSAGKPDRPARKPAPVVARTRKIPLPPHPVKRRAKKNQKKNRRVAWPGATPLRLRATSTAMRPRDHGMPMHGFQNFPKFSCCPRREDQVYCAPFYGGVAQLVSAPDCRSGGCGFEPRLSRQFFRKADSFGNRPFFVERSYCPCMPI